MTLAAMQTELAAIEAAISEQYTNGSSYNIAGGHSKTGVDIEKLERRASVLKRRIFRFQGYDSTRTAPAFNVGPTGVPYYY